MRLSNVKTVPVPILTVLYRCFLPIQKVDRCHQVHQAAQVVLAEIVLPAEAINFQKELFYEKFLCG